MFFGEFAEKDQKEIELKDVDRKCVLDRMENFLIERDEWMITDKLRIEDTYNLIGLKNRCISTLCSVVLRISRSLPSTTVSLMR
ncbi:hypothetical protein PMAYCL1PPCAC_22737 [Pristionchus mayeri]|uniref:Uncharacterized protein n=1 Tax=Pristionchus mayeri TaxID=1317129 RepID=A0AAN5I516_9BILA|nr:hypothetical protein PMAYCL1PPCAC_22737 [Pristionchus mayeri]